MNATIRSRGFVLLVALWLSIGVGLAIEVSVSEILRVNTDGSDIELIVSPMSGLAAHGVAAADPEGLFWTAWVAGASGPSPVGFGIRRATVDGNDIGLIIDGAVSDLTVDRVNQKIYYTIGAEGDCEGCGSTYRADLDGSNVEGAAFPVEHLGEIAVYPAGDTVCVSGSDGPNDGIFCGGFDEVGIPLIASLFPADMAIDETTGKLYWTEDDGVRRMNLDGSGAEDLVTGLSGVAALALDPAGNRMWWSVPSADKIQGATLDGANVQDIVTGIQSPAGIAFVPTPGGELEDKLYVLGNPIIVDLTPPVPATTSWGAIALVLLGLSSAHLALSRRRIR